MTPAFDERMQIYVVGPDQFAGLASVAAGGPKITIPFRLDPDAPFVLRGIACRCAYVSAASPYQSGLQNLLFRFAGPEQNYFMQAMTRFSLLCPWYGQAGNPHPWYPEVVYPAGSTIYIDYQLDGATALTDLTFYFFGVKLYPKGSPDVYRLPSKFSTLDFRCPRTYDDLPVTTPSNGLRSIFRPPFDADYVLRGIQAGPSFSRTSYEVFLRLLDESEQPYMNAPVHLDVLAGRSLMPAAYPSGTSFLAPTGTGASQPGLFVPEIFIPKTHILYYDLVRDDGGYAGAVAEDYPLVFVGSKVFPQ